MQSIYNVIGIDMKNLIKRLKSEKNEIEVERLDTNERLFDDRSYAYDCGKKVARKWIKIASYQEIKDALRRSDLKHDVNYFAFMRSIYFTSIEKSCPNEAEQFKWCHNDAFMNGWREGVILLWDSIKNDIDGS